MKLYEFNVRPPSNFSKVAVPARNRLSAKLAAVKKGYDIVDDELDHMIEQITPKKPL